MSVRITHSCITCGACVWECPNEAIDPGDPRPVVNEDLCTECYGFFGESQCVVVCPVAAIIVVPEEPQNLQEKFAQLHAGREAQDTWIWHRIGCAA